MTSIPTEGPRTFEDKKKAMLKVQAAVDKEYGEGSMMLMGSRPVIKCPSISTGLMDLDYRVIGIGGVPRGRITEIFGPYSCGKTTLALQIIAEAQKLGGLAGYIDAEHALDPVYARALGCDMDNIFLSQPDYGEQALSTAESIIESGGCDVLVVDSVAALVPKAELDGDMEDQTIGLQARLMSKAMRKLAGVTRKNGTALIFINQVREKIGVMYGSPETTPGGRALQFYSSVRLRMWPAQDTKEAVSKKTNIKAIKNKVGIPFKSTDADIVYGAGFDSFAQKVELALQLEVFDKAGAWYSFNGERIGQGADKVREAMATNPYMVEQVEKLIKEKLQ